MIKRKKKFIKWFIGVGITQIILSIIVILIVVSGQGMYQDGYLVEVSANAVRTCIPVIVWGLYLWNSKRVKNTFIN